MKTPATRKCDTKTPISRIREQNRAICSENWNRPRSVEATVSSADHESASLGVCSARIRTPEQKSTGVYATHRVPSELFKGLRLLLSASRCCCMRPVVQRLTVLATLRMIWVYRCLALPG